MREIRLGGRMYPAVYSASVACDVNDKFGDAEQMLSALRNENLAERMRALAWLSADMMASARRSLRVGGTESPVPPGEDEVLDLLSIRDLPEFQRDVMEALLADTKREVEVHDSKNPETTSAQAAR